MSPRITIEAPTWTMARLLEFASDVYELPGVIVDGIAGLTVSRDRGLVTVDPATSSAAALLDTLQTDILTLAED